MKKQPTTKDCIKALGLIFGTFAVFVFLFAGESIVNTIVNLIETILK